MQDISLSDAAKELRDFIQKHRTAAGIGPSRVLEFNQACADVFQTAFVAHRGEWLSHDENRTVADLADVLGVDWISDLLAVPVAQLSEKCGPVSGDHMHARTTPDALDDVLRILDRLAPVKTAPTPTEEPVGIADGGGNDSRPLYPEKWETGVKITGYANEIAATGQSWQQWRRFCEQNEVPMRHPNRQRCEVEVGAFFRALIHCKANFPEPEILSEGQRMAKARAIARQKYGWTDDELEHMNTTD